MGTCMSRTPRQPPAGLPEDLFVYKVTGCHFHFMKSWLVLGTRNWNAASGVYKLGEVHLGHFSPGACVVSSISCEACLTLCRLRILGIDSPREARKHVGLSTSAPSPSCRLCGRRPRGRDPRGQCRVARFDLWCSAGWYQQWVYLPWNSRMLLAIRILWNG